MLSADSELAGAFAGVLVALRAVGRNAAVARRTSVAGVEAVMVVEATVALVALNLRQAVAGADVVVCGTQKL